MSGIYALLDLGGAPLDPRDLSTLGLKATAEASVAATAIDAITPAAAHLLDSDDRATLFVGHLDEPQETIDRLGMAPATSDAVLARATLDRFGPAVTAGLPGSWIMVDRAATGAVTMLVGIGGRMPLLFAHAGRRLAIAPSIHVLSRLSWVGRSLDEDAFVLSLANCTLDDDRRTQTILRGVRSVPRGGWVTIAPGLPPRQHVVDPFVAVPRWRGSRADAMAAAEALLRRIVRQQLERAGAPGLLLSGGLDSSLIAWALAAEGATALPAFSSAADPARGIADETPFAAIVADTLGLTLHQVVPPLDVNVYRPSTETLAMSNAPPLSPRDYLYTAFADTAAEMGVTELFDGAHGELTFTALMPIWSWFDWPRPLARWARNAIRDRLEALRDPLDPMLNVALARHRRDHPAQALVDVISAEPRERYTRWAGERWGYSVGARPPLRRDVSEWRAGRLRLVRPFHDIRLLRLFARFPAAFMRQNGTTRWPARAVLAGRLPDAIRLRRGGMPFSPDYDVRLVEQAPVAAGRISTFRAVGCDEWFDLVWLSEGLRRIAANRSPDLVDTFRIQLTAHACEFLTWWRQG